MSGPMYLSPGAVAERLGVSIDRVHAAIEAARLVDERGRAKTFWFTDADLSAIEAQLPRRREALSSNEVPSAASLAIPDDGDPGEVIERGARPSGTAPAVVPDPASVLSSDRARPRGRAKRTEGAE